MRNLTLMTVVSVLVFMAGGLTGPVSSLYAASLGASYVAIGLLGTVASVSGLLSSYVWGRTSDLLGRRKGLLVLSLGAMATCYALITVAPGFAHLFVLRAAFSLFLAAYSTSSLALIGDILERGGTARGRRMGSVRGLGSLGFGIMAFLSGSIAEAASLRVPFGLAAALLAVATAVSLGVREPPAASGVGGNADRSIPRALWSTVRSLPAPVVCWLAGGRPARRLVGAPMRTLHVAAGGSGTGEGSGLQLRPLLVSAFLWTLATGAVYAVWANYMVSELGYSQAAMSRLWSLASTTEFPLMILAGWMSDRLGRVPMLALGFVAWTVVFSGYVFVPGMPWIIGVQLVRGFAYSAYTATAMTYATEVRARAQRGRVSGMYSTAGSVGSILGAAMGGAQTAWVGFRSMIGTNAALMLGGAVYLGAVAWGRRQAPHID
jgi:MFS family permease